MSLLHANQASNIYYFCSRSVLNLSDFDIEQASGDANDLSGGLGEKHIRSPVHTMDSLPPGTAHLRTAYASLVFREQDMPKQETTHPGGDGIHRRA